MAAHPPAGAPPGTLGTRAGGAPPLVAPPHGMNGHHRRMRFVLEVDLDALPAETRAAELGRILRYWGGAMKDVELVPGARQELRDSGYAVVGEWRVEDVPTG